MKLLVLTLLTGLIVASTCKEKDGRQLTKEEFNEQKQLFERANKQLVKQDKEKIESYAARRNWNMELTESGLYFEIVERGDGPMITSGKNALIDYDVTLLDGTPCYSSKEAGPKNIGVGMGHEESGLIQGLLMLREGDRARFILPPHIAHGLLGDENMIPPRSVIVYQLKVLKVTE